MDRLKNLGFLIKDTARLYVRLFEQRMRHMGVTLDQAKVLAYLSKNEGVSQIRLAELSGVDPMGLVRLLDRMEGDGWIERRPHPTDRRARQLYVLEKAQPFLEQLWKESDAVRAQVFSGFKAQERTQLIDLLERARTNLLDAKADEPESKVETAVASAASRPKSAKSRSAR
jgi:DNA-binding MarR family transcriptional regulator